MIKNGKKMVVVKNSGPIAELGFITGPIIFPVYVDLKAIGRLIDNGYTVEEVNPENKSDRVKLTIRNYTNEDNFKKYPSDPAPKAPIKQPEPPKTNKDNDKKTQKAASTPARPEAPKTKENEVPATNPDSGALNPIKDEGDKTPAGDTEQVSPVGSDFTLK